MNSVILSGYTVREIELKYTTGAEPKAVCKFTLAVAKPVKGSGADFINCIIWGKSAENFSKLVTKGQRIIVHGSWTTGSFNGKSGGKVYTNECNVQTWEFAGADKKADTVSEGGYDPSIPDDASFDEIPFS